MVKSKNKRRLERQWDQQRQSHESSSSVSTDNKRQRRGGAPQGGGSQRPPPRRAFRTAEEEIATLEERIGSDEVPERGTVPIRPPRDGDDGDGVERGNVKFRDLPLSSATLRGLGADEDDDDDRGGGGGGSSGSHGGDRRRGRGGRGRGNGGKRKGKSFVTCTDIQAACIPHALAGRDVLGAAKTGSGKTLAFLVPLVEKLYRCRWAPSDGPGAIVLSPTRELALQIFDVLRVVGSCHHLSAGVVVGGGRNDFAEEQASLPGTNIVVATPGRLLQHLEQTPGFDASDVMVLVLDEADRILDMGFRDQLHRIMEYLPAPPKSTSNSSSSPQGLGGGGRQTLLFSATQTRRVKDLARLSLRRPEYVGVHDAEAAATPDRLRQSMVVCPLHHKLDLLFSFVKSHLRHRTVVFFSTCAQVRYVYDLFCRLQPGVPLLALHGKIKQERRSEIYRDFAARGRAVLFATDLAARGLDFPSVDWVVQADAPEDRDAYVHRAGRTARYDAGGRSLLVVLPSEVDGVERMLGGGGPGGGGDAAATAGGGDDGDAPGGGGSRIPIKRLSVNPDRAVSVSGRAASVVAADATVKRLAERAFTSYVRSVALMPNGEAFRVSELPLDDFAVSLGLASTPSTRFLRKLATRDEYRSKKNKNYKLERLKELVRAEKLKRRIDRLDDRGEKVPKDAGGESKDQAATGDKIDVGELECSPDDLLVVKRKPERGGGGDDCDGDGDGVRESPVPPLTASSVHTSMTKRIRLHGGTGSTQRIVFDDEGKERPSLMSTLEHPKSGEEQRDLACANESYLTRVRERLATTKERDRAEEKARIKEKHRKKRMQAKGDLGADDDDDVEGGGGITLTPREDDSDALNSPKNGSSENEVNHGGYDNVEDEGEFDVKIQEDLALTLLRKENF